MEAIAALHTGSDSPRRSTRAPAASSTGPTRSSAPAGSPRRCAKTITDPRVRHLPLAGAVDQFTDSTDAAGDPAFLRPAWTARTWPNAL